MKERLNSHPSLMSQERSFLKDNNKVLKKFLKERDAAFLSRSKAVVRAWAKKWNKELPSDDFELDYMINRTILDMSRATERQRQMAAEWLKANVDIVETGGNV